MEEAGAIRPAVTDCARCRVFALPTPVVRYDPRDAAGKSRRAYIDEGSDDLVLIGDSDAIFCRLGLTKGGSGVESDVSPPAATSSPRTAANGPGEGRPTSRHVDAADASGGGNSSGGSGATDSLAAPPACPLMNVLHLRTAGKSRIRIAKRCPAPSPSLTAAHHPTYLVAVVHDELTVDLYLPAAAPLQQPRWAGCPGSATPGTVAFASWQCRPNNLRFGSRAYPIRTVAWSVGPEVPSGASGGANAGSGSSRAVISMATMGGAADAMAASFASSTSNGGYPPSSAAPSITTTKYLIVLSEIAVDLVHVRDTPDTEPAAILTKRVVTRIDHWCFDGASRVFTLINKMKLNIVKPFIADRASVVRPLPKFKLSDVGELAPAAINPSAMDAPGLNLLVQPLTVAGSVFVAHLNTQCELVLLRWVPEPGGSADTAAAGRGGGVADSAGAGASGGSGGGDGGGPSSGASASRSSVMGAANTGDHSHVTVDGSQLVSPASPVTSPAGPGGGSFVPAVVLNLQQSGGAARLQVLDNLLIAHFPLSATAAAFDLTLADTVAGVASRYPGSALARHHAASQSPSTPSSGLNMGSSLKSSFGWRERLRSVRGGAAASGAGTPRSPRGTLRPAAAPGPLFFPHSYSGGSGGDAEALDACESNATISSLIDARQPVLAPVGGNLATMGFYNGVVPLILDRQHGVVLVLGVDAAAMAAGIGDLCARTQFLLNRCEGGGLAVPQMLHSLLEAQAPLGVVGVIFDLIAEESARIHRVHRASPTAVRKGLPYGLPAPASHSTIGSRAELASVIPALGATSPPAHRDGDIQWLSFEAAVRVAAPHGGAGGPPWTSQRRGWIHRGCVDQQCIYHVVFAPLAARAFREAGPASAVSAAASQSSVEDLRVNDSDARQALIFARYLLAALIEYARALVQHGSRLSEALQQLMIHAFLLVPAPDYFRFHQLLMYRAVDDHVATAQRLMRMQTAYPPAFQLGLDMLTRLAQPLLIIDEFLASNAVVRAAKFIAENRIKGAPVLRVLQRAQDTMDIEATNLQVTLAAYGGKTPQAKQLQRKLDVAVAEYCTTFQLLSRHLAVAGESVDGFSLHQRRYDDLCERGPG